MNVYIMSQQMYSILSLLVLQTNSVMHQDHTVIKCVDISYGNVDFF